MKRSGFAYAAATLVVAGFALLSVGWLAAPALAQSVTIRQPAALPAPTNFKVAPAGDHIALTWDAVSGAASYTVYRGTSSHGEALYKAGITSALFDNTSHVTKGVIYYYEVAAVDGQGVEGARSSEGASTMDTAIAVTTPVTKHGSTAATASSNGTFWWLLLGILSLAALISGVYLFLRQHQSQSQAEPVTGYTTVVTPQSGAFVAPQPTPMTNPRAVTAQPFPPRDWNDLSPAERGGVSGVFTAPPPPPPPPPEPENYGRQLGAVAFWDDPSESGNALPPPRRDGERSQWAQPQPQPPSWPQERDR